MAAWRSGYESGWHAGRVTQLGPAWTTHKVNVKGMGSASILLATPTSNHAATT